MIVWLIGMSGAGKTAVGTRVTAALKPHLRDLVRLDGDLLREVWGDDLGHDLTARETNAGRISRLCAMLDRQGVHVVASVLSVFPDWQAWNRTTFSQYFEVFLDAPMHVLRARDTKGIYAAAEAGRMSDVVGVDIPFPRPAHPDLVLDSHGPDNTPDRLTERIVTAVTERIR
ncbi:MAG TPA: adenylyl-sulfate kinase [Streptomyces sp.]|uniref:adenylyl-sulfate kinase n=1 Tax=Streptomyces sp. TaxID=1931 RepID=UPI002D32D7A0|nr:adenylyl-sulfate kinase [Streptomyces sp.]HZG04587.1 adenylyl-sulfate kinase [Streptomyces sp.]